MILLKNIYSSVRNLSAAFLVTVMLLSVSCNNDRSGEESSDVANLSLFVRAAASSINTDVTFWEDRVDQLRMLVFDSGDGSVVYNEPLYFPNGFNARSRAVRLKPGTYDFYFVANESVYTGDFVNALKVITNVSQFSSDSRFTNLAYRPGFVPDGSTANGRFVMTAIYNEVAIEAGGSENNPLPFPVPGNTVELIRSLAKVEVIFRKRVAGSDVPENTVTSVSLANVAADISAPPLDTYYPGSLTASGPAMLTGFDYTADSIGALAFYIPEFLVPAGGTTYTELLINNNSYPMESDGTFGGLAEQRREITGLSTNSVIRNYHYIIDAYINAEGGIQLYVYIEPWKQDGYTYLFQGDQQITIPPVEPTDSSIIIQTECGRIEILSENEFLGQGLQGAYNDIVTYYDPETQGPLITRGDPPYYCEKKYGEGWRLINSCELLSFLAAFHRAYNIWTSNTWEADTWNMPYYSLPFRTAAQQLLEKLTGDDLSGSVLMNTNNNADVLTDLKLGIIDDFFTPGDIMLREDDFPGGWPYAAPPGTSEKWYYNEVVIQVEPYWYGSNQWYNVENRSNWDEVLYERFERYDFSSTVSRCVRVVE